MRSVMISVSGFAIAIVLALFLLLSGSGRQAQTSEHHGVDEERIASMEQKQSEVRRELEQLKNSIEMIENRLAQLGGQGGKMGAQAKETASSAAPVAEGPADRKEAAASGESGEESVRQIVREELKRVEEERKQELAKQREAQKPEDWEKREFGNYAWNVHFMGLRLGLTDDQKRQYYTITKETAEQMQGLWQELKGQHPQADSGRLSAIYQEHIQEIQRAQRDAIMDILNEEQRKKYNEMYGGNQGVGKR